MSFKVSPAGNNPEEVSSSACSVYRSIKACPSTPFSCLLGGLCRDRFWLSCCRLVVLRLARAASSTTRFCRSVSACAAGSGSGPRDVTCATAVCSKPALSSMSTADAAGCCSCPPTSASPAMPDADVAIVLPDGLPAIGPAAREHMQASVRASIWGLWCRWMPAASTWPAKPSSGAGGFESVRWGAPRE